MSDFKRKRLSGSTYRKKRLAKEAEHQKASGSIEKFILTSSNSIAPNSCITTAELSSCITSAKSTSCITTTESTLNQKLLLMENHEEKHDEEEEDMLMEEETPNQSIPETVSDDPADWKNLGISQHQLIIEKGSVQIKGINFPQDVNGRHFSDFHYQREMSNGEKLKRKWLVYSVKRDCVYCFCCYLFNSDIATNWYVQGFNDWKNISRTLKYHECSKNHVLCFEKWMELDIRLKKGETIDKEHQRLIEI